jgi:hypothetical protein
MLAGRVSEKPPREEGKMDHKCRPAQRRGERNILCVHYNDCLDYVIRNAWESWDCGDCCHRHNQEARPEMRFVANEEVAYYDLPFEL